MKSPQTIESLRYIGSGSDDNVILVGTVLSENGATW